ncbi:c-type cytochrome [Leeia oryzae]|uniref:c-type cytochrome n=1 Tax=Leeia oryzae TaxID=356662 RepID=UPI00047665D6|nr:c-type cytochrome [Leeia oryzae]
MKKLTLMLAICAGIGMTAAHAADPQQLAKDKNCLSCHGVDNKILGPAYKMVAAKYKGKAGMEAQLADKIRKGGAGVWGPIPMPANNVTEEEAKTLAHWILSL